MTTERELTTITEEISEYEAFSETDNIDYPLIGGIAGGLLVICIVLIIVIIMLMKKRNNREKTHETKLEMSTQPSEYRPIYRSSLDVPLVPVMPNKNSIDKSWLIDASALQYENEIGKGCKLLQDYITFFSLWRGVQRSLEGSTW